MCEGVEDASFLRELIGRCNLGHFDVRPARDIGGIGGISGFREGLTTAVGHSGFRRISRMALVADCDTHHRETMRSICEQISEANQQRNVAGRFAIPHRAYEATGGHPRLTVILLPGPNARGALETLLWKAITNLQAHRRIAQCIETACVGAGITRWPQSKADKARVHAALAFMNRDNPAIGLGRLWSRYPDLIPVTHKAFDDIETALRAL